MQLITMNRRKPTTLSRVEWVCGAIGIGVVLFLALLIIHGELALSHEWEKAHEEEDRRAKARQEAYEASMQEWY